MLMPSAPHAAAAGRSGYPQLILELWGLADFLSLRVDGYSRIFVP